MEIQSVGVLESGFESELEEENQLPDVVSRDERKHLALFQKASAENDGEAVLPLAAIKPSESKALAAFPRPTDIKHQPNSPISEGLVDGVTAVIGLGLACSGFGFAALAVPALLSALYNHHVKKKKPTEGTATMLAMSMLPFGFGRMGKIGKHLIRFGGRLKKNFMSRFAAGFASGAGLSAFNHFIGSPLAIKLGLEEKPQKPSEFSLKKTLVAGLMGGLGFSLFQPITEKGKSLFRIASKPVTDNLQKKAVVVASKASVEGKKGLAKLWENRGVIGARIAEPFKFMGRKISEGATKVWENRAVIGSTLAKPFVYVAQKAQAAYRVVVDNRQVIGSTIATPFRFVGRQLKAGGQIVYDNRQALGAKIAQPFQYLYRVIRDRISKRPPEPPMFSNNAWR